MAAVKFHRNYMGGLELGQLFRTRRLRSVRYLTADIFGAAEAAADMKNCGECGGPIGILFLGGAAAGAVCDLCHANLGAVHVHLCPLS